MLRHLFGVISCVCSLGYVGVKTTNDFYRSNSNGASTLMSSIDEYQSWSLSSVPSSIKITRFYYDFDINTYEFTFTENLDFSNNITSLSLSTPSSISDADTILLNYININKLVSASNYTYSDNNDLCIWFVFDNTWVYRIASYNPYTFANYGYLEYFDCTNGNYSNFSLVKSDDISGFSSSVVFNYSNFSHSSSYNEPFYSYFDRQSYGCFSRLFYVSNYTNIHYADLELDLRIDFQLYSLDNSYARGLYDGRNQGIEAGRSVGYEEGYNQGYSDGYNVGYNASQPLSMNFLSLIGAIADTPVLVIRNLYSFDLFGMSALTIFMSILTAIIVIHFIRKFI